MQDLLTKTMLQQMMKQQAHGYTGSEVGMMQAAGQNPILTPFLLAIMHKQRMADEQNQANAQNVIDQITQMQASQPQQQADAFANAKVIKDKVMQALYLIKMGKIPEEVGADYLQALQETPAFNNAKTVAGIGTQTEISGVGPTGESLFNMYKQSLTNEPITEAPMIKQQPSRAEKQSASRERIAADRNATSSRNAGTMASALKTVREQNTTGNQQQYDQVMIDTGGGKFIPSFPGDEKQYPMNKFKRRYVTSTDKSGTSSTVTKKEPK